MKLRLIFGLALLSLVFGCSTEVELNAPYESTTVVFGILDAKQSRQYVKINRTYLGDGNNAEYAQIRDSLEYEWDEFNSITMSEIVNGNVVETYPLDSITIENKETDGVFYAPVQTVYYFDVAQADEDGNYLNPDAIYELEVDFKNKEDVSAQTDIVTIERNDLQGPLNNDNYKINFVQNYVNDIPNFQENFSLRWSVQPGVERYEYSFTFEFKEKVWAEPVPGNETLTDEYVRQMEWKLGEITSPSPGTNSIETSVNGASFFSTVDARIEEDPFITREMGIIDGDVLRSIYFNISVSNEVLNTYLSVNEPVTGIVQERPEYTNVDNGIGILASRGTNNYGPYSFNQASKEYLYNSNQTGALNFCSPVASDNSQVFSCN